MSHSDGYPTRRTNSSWTAWDFGSWKSVGASKWTAKLMEWSKNVQKVFDFNLSFWYEGATDLRLLNFHRSNLSYPVWKIWTAISTYFNTPRTISPTRGHKSYVGWLAGWSGPDSRCTTDMGNDDNDATMVIDTYEMDNAKSMRAYISCLCISLSDFVGIVDLYTTLKPSQTQWFCRCLAPICPSEWLLVPRHITAYNSI